MHGFLFLMEGVFLEKRLGFIGIIVEHRDVHAAQVNDLLTRYGHLVIARTGVPHCHHGSAVISLIVEATTDEIGELTGRLGSISGVSVKSMLSRNKQLTGGENAASEDKHPGA